MRTKTKGRANYILNMRRNRGLAQKQLAMLLGLHATMVSKYETGAALPTLQAALLLEIVLGIRLCDLYVGWHQELQHQILKRSERLPHAVRQSLRSRIQGKDVHEHT